MFEICLPDDADQAAAVLTDAFLDDPLMAFVFPDPELRPGRLGRFASVIANRGIASGHGYKVVDRPGGELLGAAMWAPPGKRFFEPSDGERLADIVVAADPARAATVFAGFSELGPHHPDEPHFYLQMIGVRRSARGRGIGAELLAGTLELVDRVGAVAHLESSNPRNLTLYRRAGFEVTAEVAMPEGGPVMRPMVRPSRR